MTTKSKLPKNINSTRYASTVQENNVAVCFGGRRTPNSGAGLWKKGDVVIADASLLIECKVSMEDKQSFSIKKDWIEKNKEETFENRLDNSAIAFNFGPNQPNYYVIDEKLMKFLVEKLEEENNG